MDGIFLLLGSNLGNRESNLIQAQSLIRSRIGDIRKASAAYKTDPWGVKNQNWFLNQALEIETGLSPLELLATIHQIEMEMGRVRKQKWQERTIDIDILYYRDLISHQESLVIPHPGIPFRRFTLVPLAEIAAQLVHPVVLKTQHQLLVECEDHLGVEQFDEAASLLAKG